MGEPVRYPFLDVFRGLAIVAMLFHHVPEWTAPDASTSPLFWLMFLVSRFAAPMFLFAAGFSVVLSYRRTAREGSLDATGHILKRGIYLIFLGAALSLVYDGDFLNLNILYTIGLSLIILAPLQEKPNLKAHAAYAAAALLLVRAFEASGNAALLSAFDFPPVPYVVYGVFGSATGVYFLDHRDTRRTAVLFERAAFLLSITSVLLLVAGAPLQYIPYPSEAFISATIAFCLYLASLLMRFCPKVENKLLEPLLVYGRNSLFIYFAHHVLFLALPNALGVEKQTPVEGSLPLIALFLAAAFLFLSHCKRPVFQGASGKGLRI